MVKKLIKKIFNNILRPHKIPIKIFDKIYYFYKYNNYNQNIFEKAQDNLFNHYKLSRQKGVENLRNVKQNLAKNLNINRGMSSEHEVFFSSLSLNNNHKIKNILEIGTFDGFNALLLSKLFTKTNIDTIDLPENHKDFINTYHRKSNFDKFIKDRNHILSKNEKINFFSLNSLKLLNYNKKYDLIWIDGAHGYPIVCIDIINSLHLLNKDGFIVCDDVHKNLNQTNSDKMYNSIASYETLNELSEENLIEFKLLYKRLDAKNNCLEGNRKFLAIARKS